MDPDVIGKTGIDGTLLGTEATKVGASALLARLQAKRGLDRWTVLISKVSPSIIRAHKDGLLHRYQHDRLSAKPLGNRKELLKHPPERCR